MRTIDGKVYVLRYDEHATTASEVPSPRLAMMISICRFMRVPSSPSSTGCHISAGLSFHHDSDMGRVVTKHHPTADNVAHYDAAGGMWTNANE